jgi:hypothetical protein
MTFSIAAGVAFIGFIVSLQVRNHPDESTG